jgi:ADP-ribose pyrophosphatase
VSAGNDLRILWQGRHLDAVARGRWEFVRRRGSSGVVGIVPITDDGRLVLVEQFRPPIARPSIELPAGLVGDSPDLQGESLIVAARRELHEETGYEARRMTFLGEAYSSPGLSDELVTLMLAGGLSKTGDGGGDDTEEITVHEVALGEVYDYLARRFQAGAAIDFKIYAGLYLAEHAPRT